LALGEGFMRNIFISGLLLSLSASSAFAQGVAGQPTLMSPQVAPSRPPAAIRTPAAKPPAAATKPSINAATPEARSAAELALGSEPVFDEDTFKRIKDALLDYSDIQVRGGWPALPPDAKLAPGASGPDVATLRQRLVISDDMPTKEATGDSYDAAVAEGVKHFQLRHGLDATGTVGVQTLKALNVPIGERIKQLEASLDRLLGMDFQFAERYVVVNIPAAFV
jgi:murein L,D-transpeptidase YcbB/YkuD